MNKYKLEDYLPEEEFNQIDEPEDPQHIDDIPSVKLHVDDNDKLTIQISAFYHGPENKKIPLLVGNEVLQDLLLKAFQIESQKMFRKVVHGILGEPYGLPENKINKTMTNESKLWQLRAGLITESEYQESVDEAGFNPSKTSNVAGDGPRSVQDLAVKLRDIGLKLKMMKGIDTTEIKALGKLLDDILSKIETGNLGTALTNADKMINTATKNIEPSTDVVK